MEITPVRKISNKRSSKKTGFFPSNKNQRSVAFESLLERDYIYLLEFDQDVISYIEQPMTIKYSFNGKCYKYTPDFQVLRKTKSQIIEIKPKAKLIKILKDENKYRGLQAGFKYAQAYDSEYKIVTDNDIHVGCLLKNIKYLFTFSNIDVPDKLRRSIITELSMSNQMQIKELVTKLTINDHHEKNKIIAYIFAMIYKHYILTNLYEPITLQSIIKQNNSR